MSAPERSEEVRRVIERFAHLTTWPAEDAEDRRRRFLPVLIEEMPAGERANWGVLLKTERTPPYIPSDILVWRPTMEHVDVLSDREVSPGTWQIRAAWKNHGAIGKAPGTENKVGKWVWLDVRDAKIPPIEPPKPPEPPEPPNPPNPPDDPDDYERRVLESYDRIAQGIENIAQGLQAVAAIAERLERDGVKVHG